jgi:hypothetical protein
MNDLNLTPGMAESNAAKSPAIPTVTIIRTVKGDYQTLTSRMAQEWNMRPLTNR